MNEPATDSRAPAPHEAPRPAARRRVPSAPPLVRGPVAVLAVVALALVGGGCRAQVTGTGSSAPPVRVSHGSTTDAKNPAPVRPRTAASRTPAKPTKPAPPKPAAKPKPATLMAQGARSGQVRELQARLRGLQYFGRTPTGFYGTVTADSVSAFQRRHGLPVTGVTDTVTWQKLLTLSRAPGHDELYPPTTLPVGKPDARCMTGRAMCISKKSRTLSWIVDGKILSSMDVRFGAQYTPTREGTFSVGWKSRHHVSTLYDSPMPYAMFFSGGQAVHYSSDFAARGYSGASHGCVNVRDEKKIASLFAQVHTGDKVVVYG